MTGMIRASTDGIDAELPSKTTTVPIRRTR